MKKLYWSGLLAIWLSAATFCSYARADSIIARVITHLSPNVTQKDAEEYATIIAKYSEEYDIEWKVVVALMKQESDFIMGEISADYHDFGIGQLNYRTIKHYRFDLAKLLSDPDYAFECTYKVLADLKGKYYNKKAKGKYQWFTRYHSFTPERRHIYWYGEKSSGRDGLAYKFRLIEKVLKENERTKFKPKPANSSSDRTRDYAESRLDVIDRRRKGRVVEKSEERVSCGLQLCPIRPNVRRKSVDDPKRSSP